MLQLNSGKVVAVGHGVRDKEGKFIPVAVKEGDTVLLPDYGGTEVKLGDKEYVYISQMALLFVFLDVAYFQFFNFRIEFTQCSFLFSFSSLFV